MFEWLHDIIISVSMSGMLPSINSFIYLVMVPTEGEYTGLTWMTVSWMTVMRIMKMTMRMTITIMMYKYKMY